MPKGKHDDPATRYARRVDKGRILAGDPVREACERHLRDLESPHHLWMPQRGDRFARFCYECCVVENPITSDLEPFELLDWQAFICYSIFGWAAPERDKLQRPPGARRFRHAYIETAKGSGKSPMGAGIALYMLTADIYEDLNGVKRPQMEPQCFATASTLDQAIQVALMPAAQMVNSSERLQHDAGCKVLGGTKPDRIISVRRGGFFNAVSTNWGGHGKSGLRVSFVQAEELHEQTSRTHIDNLEAGFKGRPQPLMLMLTNAGKKKEGPAWEEHQKALQCNRDTAMDNYFSYVATCDDSDFPEAGSAGRRWHPVKRVWKKANPSLGTTIRYDYINDRIAKATTEPDRMEVGRLNFGKWGTIDSDYISWPLWKKAECEPFSDDDLAGAKLYLAGDLAALHDLTSLACIFHCTDGLYRLRVYTFTARDTLPERDDTSSGHLLDWAARGLIETVPGNILTYGIMARRIIGLVEAYDCEALAIDPYHGRLLKEALEALEFPFWQDDDKIEFYYREGLEIVNHPQGYYMGYKDDPRKLGMPLSVDLFEGMVKASPPEILIEKNPVLRWNLNSAVVVPDDQNNRKFSKRRSELNNHGKIDGLVASVMAAGLAKRPEEEQPKSPWEDPNFSLDDD